MQKITATLQIIDYKTDKVISERIVGKYDDEDTASFSAHKQRKEGESVALYGCAPIEPEDMSALEIAELEAEWNDIAR